jgi:phosphonate transport system permease protein
MTPSIAGMYRASPLARTLGGFIVLAFVLLLFADVEISTVDPWAEFGRLLLGVITPDFTATENILNAILYTIAFALLGVTFAVIFGFALALVFQNPLVRGFCATIRAVHELFWALIFLQIFGQAFSPSAFPMPGLWPRSLPKFSRRQTQGRLPPRHTGQARFPSCSS